MTLILVKDKFLSCGNKHREGNKKCWISFSSVQSMFPHGFKPTIALLLCVTVHTAFPWLVSLLHDSKLRTVVLNHSTGWSDCCLQWLLDICPKFSLNLQRFTAQRLNWIAVDWFIFMNLTLAQLMKTFAIHILLHCLQVYLLEKKKTVVFKSSFCK